MPTPPPQQAKTIAIAFNVGDRVKIVDLEGQKARVSAISIGWGGITYEVGYFSNGSRQSAYLRDYELEAVE